MAYTFTKASEGFYNVKCSEIGKIFSRSLRSFFLLAEWYITRIFIPIIKIIQIVYDKNGLNTSILFKIAYYNVYSTFNMFKVRLLTKEVY